MKTILRLEQVAFFLVSLALLVYLQVPWWVFFPGLLISDTSMIGYLFGNKVGAISYNLVHHQGLALILACIGLIFSIQWLLILGAVLFAHSAMDRIVGYGLKYTNGFQHTHLGDIK